MGLARRRMLGALAVGLLLVLYGCIRVTREFGEVTSSATASSQSEIEIRNLYRPGDGPPTRLVGTWTGTFQDTNDDRHGHLQLKLVRDLDGGGTRTFAASVSGDEVQAFVRTSGFPRLELKRDAGTLVLDGAIAGRRGSGSATFDAGEDYLREMSKLTGESLDPMRAMELALVDLPLDYARKVCGAGYEASVSNLVGLRFSGVSAEYAVGLRDAGYRFTLDEVRSLRFGGIDLNYAKAYRSAGYDLTADELRSLRFAGVSPECAAGYRQAGYELDVDTLRSLRFSGVPSEYARELAEAGYRFDPAELRNLRFAGVPADYAVSLKKAGYDFSADELRRLRFSGVDAEYAVAAAAPDKEKLTAEELIRLRHRGVDVETIRKLRQ